MCGLSGSLDGSLNSAIEAIDRANADDPNRITVRGADHALAEVHGQLASEWVRRLEPAAGDAVVIAARAHHLRRWELARATYPEGRAGYLRWRRDQKARHARDVEQLLIDAGYGPAVIERVQALLRREGLGTDVETQLVEDAACLVFLETQLASTAARLDRDHMLEVIRKTARKMSPAAIALVAEIPLTADEQSLLADALA